MGYLSWVAAKELRLNYHHMSIQYIVEDRFLFMATEVKFSLTATQ